MCGWFVRPPLWCRILGCVLSAVPLAVLQYMCTKYDVLIWFRFWSCGLAPKQEKGFKPPQAVARGQAEGIAALL